MKETLYSRRSNLVVGFHGCDQSIANKIIEGKDDLIASTNDYDWLGHGIYFWENNELRALQYANDMMGRAHSSVKCPAVIGAIIDLGYCMDLTDSLYLGELKESYNVLVETCRVTGISLPTNSTIEYLKISYCADWIVQLLKRHIRLTEKYQEENLIQ